MISIDLRPAEQQRLERIAQRQGQDGTHLARQVLLDYLDLQELSDDTEEAWADASVSLTPEIMGHEAWDDSGHGS